LNRSNLRAPNGNRSANPFGTVTSSYDPRIRQVRVKLSWTDRSGPAWGRGGAPLV
jgi:hypothetical protein